MSEAVGFVLADGDAAYRHLFVGSSVPIFVMERPSLRILDANPAAVALYGYTLEELRRMSAPDVSAEPHKTLEDLSAGVERVRGRYHRRRDGALMLVDIALSIVSEGDRSYYIAFVDDRSERARAEAALSASESKFQTAFRTSPDAISITRLEDGVYLDVNEGFCSMSGYEVHEVVGRSAYDIDIWLDHHDRDNLIAQLKSDGVAYVEAAFRRKDGSTVFGLMSARRMSFGDEDVLLAVTRDITDRREYEEALLASNSALESMALDVTDAMGRVVEIRDPYTRGHQLRVREIATAIGREMGLSEEELAALSIAASVHDIGKLGVPVEILTHPKQLSDIEFDIVRTHPQQGYEILREIAFPWPVAQIVLQHHERCDGSGYPQGLKAEETLLLAKVLSVADVVEAMASHRPYRAALGLDAAIAEIDAHPEHYDPDVSAACRALYERGEIEV